MRLHNTLTGKVEDFTPLQDNKVTLYTCGPTVYNALTVGNWIAYLRWDLLVRALNAQNFYIERVMNITDVGHLVSDADEGEDKMQKGAKREGIGAWEIASRYTEAFIEGMNSLNLLIPQHLTKATEHIPSQIALIETLEQKKHTYRTSDGLYFDTKTFPNYAKFANLDLEGQKAGARVVVNNEKRNPSDFALWKFSPANEQRDMEWDSPWGKGFPGWHIECSAMAMQYLGSTIDMHTGGVDHIPVHHTNEIAQSEAASGHQFSRFWLHANFLMVDGRKISKSLGNGFTLDDLKKKGFSPEAFRMFALQSHYRTESNFTWSNLSAAAQRLKHWESLAVIRWQMHDTLVDSDDRSTDQATVDLLGYVQSARDAIADDLNSPEALKIIEEALTVVLKHHADIQQSAFEKVLDFIEQVLGLPIRLQTPDIDEEAKLLFIERSRAREAADWSKSDELRAALLKKGILVRDGSSTQFWAYN